MRLLVLITLSSLILFSCENKATTTTANEENLTNEAPVPGSAGIASSDASQATYPSISIDRLEYLWNNANYMDVVFYELPVSLNQSTPEQIRSTIAHISEKPPIIDPNCKAVGRIFFQVDGVNVEEADIYFQNGCTFYLWLKDGKPTHANTFTQAGIDFYNNIYAQVQQMNQ